MFLINPNQTYKNNEPKKTKDSRKCEYNRANFELHL